MEMQQKSFQERKETGKNLEKQKKSVQERKETEKNLEKQKSVQERKKTEKNLEKQKKSVQERKETEKNLEKQKKSAQDRKETGKNLEKQKKSIEEWKETEKNLEKQKKSVQERKETEKNLEKQKKSVQEWKKTEKDVEKQKRVLERNCKKGQQHLVTAVTEIETCRTSAELETTKAAAKLASLGLLKFIGQIEMLWEITSSYYDSCFWGQQVSLEREELMREIRRIRAAYTAQKKVALRSSGDNRSVELQTLKDQRSLYARKLMEKETQKSFLEGQTKNVQERKGIEKGFEEQKPVLQRNCVEGGQILITAIDEIEGIFSELGRTKVATESTGLESMKFLQVIERLWKITSAFYDRSAWPKQIRLGEKRMNEIRRIQASYSAEKELVSRSSSGNRAVEFQNLKHRRCLYERKLMGTEDLEKQKRVPEQNCKEGQQHVVTAAGGNEMYRTSAARGRTKADKNLAALESAKFLGKMEMLSRLRCASFGRGPWEQQMRLEEEKKMNEFRRRHAAYAAHQGSSSDVKLVIASRLFDNNPEL